MEDLTVIELAISDLHVGSFQDYLDRCKPHSVKELFDAMEAYTKSDNGGRRRNEAMKGEKKAKKKRSVVAAEAVERRPAEATEPKACEHCDRGPRAIQLHWLVQ